MYWGCVKERGWEGKKFKNILDKGNSEKRGKRICKGPFKYNE